MHYQIFSPTQVVYSEYAVAFLVPSLNYEAMLRTYILGNLDGQEDHIIAYDLYQTGKKTKMVEMRHYLATELLPEMERLKVKYLMVCNADYFKALTQGKTAEASLGYVHQSSGSYKDPDGNVYDLSGFNVIYCPDYRGRFRDPVKFDRALSQSMHALKTHAQGTYQDPGQGVIKSAAYPNTPEAIRAALQQLLDLNQDLTADIETFSLKHYDAGIGTIAFGVDQTRGLAFGVDIQEGPDKMPMLRPEQDSRNIREILIWFFIEFKKSGRSLIWHNISFDVTVLIYQLFMNHILDTEGLLDGLEILVPGNQWHCTRVITYLATNSCAGNKLGLKENAHEYVGNYAVDGIKNIMAIPMQHLLEYNLVDCLATWYVFDKHYPMMVADQQRDLYQDRFRPWTVDIIQMQLTGMPINRQKVIELRAELIEFTRERTDRMRSNVYVQNLVYQMKLEWVVKRNQELKVKRVTVADAEGKIDFNPNSNPQLQRIIYDESFMNLPVLDLTDSNLPATGADSLRKLMNYTNDDEVLEFLEDLAQYKRAEKILSAFIPAFLNACEGPDGWHYLFGNFNLGGTVSGRLSSSGPNLQNLPSNDDPDSIVKWAKKVKGCFEAPMGWLFVGLDFDSLEDRISALVTKDPNKLKVYVDGYDGHCLRAYSYFEDQMPDIDPKDVDSINSIKKKYPDLRQDSKTPTFLLTYGGTWMGIVDQMNWPEDKAMEIEAKYHELYAVSDQVIQDRVDQAAKDGYATVAFGLRVRTPILAQTILNTSKTPKEAPQEARTVGNAMGQSYGMLNNRAHTEFMGKVRTSRVYRTEIRPCAHIHDAQYFMIRDDFETLMFVNDNLVPAVQWQADPAISHPDVHLGGEVSVFYPSWAEEMVIPNVVSRELFGDLLKKHLEKYGLT